jgi:hypothetical protein
MYSVGLAVTMATQLSSLLGIPLLVTGAFQLIIGTLHRKIKRTTNAKKIKS